MSLNAAAQRREWREAYASLKHADQATALGGEDLETLTT
jgi:hypothetical protein